MLLATMAWFVVCLATATVRGALAALRALAIARAVLVKPLLWIVRTLVSAHSVWSCMIKPLFSRTYAADTCLPRCCRPTRTTHAWWSSSLSLHSPTGCVNAEGDATKRRPDQLPKYNAGTVFVANHSSVLGCGVSRAAWQRHSACRRARMPSCVPRSASATGCYPRAAMMGCSAGCPAVSRR
jgi:hypothetical protein